MTDDEGSATASAIFTFALTGVHMTPKAERFMKGILRQQLETGSGLDALVAEYKPWLYRRRKHHLRAAWMAFLRQYPTYNKRTDFRAYAIAYMTQEWSRFSDGDHPPSTYDAIRHHLWWSCWYGTKAGEKPLPRAPSQFNCVLNSANPRNDRTKMD